MHAIEGSNSQSVQLIIGTGYALTRFTNKCFNCYRAEALLCSQPLGELKLLNYKPMDIRYFGSSILVSLENGKMKIKAEKFYYFIGFILYKMEHVIVISCINDNESLDKIYIVHNIKN